MAIAFNGIRGLEGKFGKLKTVASSDPAANTEHSYTVPAGKMIELYAINFNLVTDGNAANRRVVVTIDDGTTVVAKIPSGHLQAASLTYNYSFVVGGQTLSAVIGTDTCAQLPGPLLLPAGYRIKTVTANIQATDNYGVATLLVNWLA